MVEIIWISSKSELRWNKIGQKSRRNTRRKVRRKVRREVRRMRRIR